MAITTGPISAQQHLAKLQADPAWVATRQEKERKGLERVEQWRREQKPLLDDLAAIGVVVDSAWRLHGIQNPDERIFPILLDHLTRPYSPRVVEGIARAFAVKSARPIVWDALVTMLKSHALADAAVEGVMAAISELAQPRDLQTLIDLLADRSLGSPRIFLVANLMRSKKPEARTALLRLQDDPDLAREITARLAGRGSTR